MSYNICVYDTPLGIRWLEALKDNLKKKRILEKNFCFLGFADSNRNLNNLVDELNQSIKQINSFEFDPPYANIHPFVTDDFQYSANLPTGICDEGKEMSKPGLRLKHESCNLYIGTLRNCRAPHGSCHHTTSRPICLPSTRSGNSIIFATRSRVG